MQHMPTIFPSPPFRPSRCSRSRLFNPHLPSDPLPPPSLPRHSQSLIPQSHHDTAPHAFFDSIPLIHLSRVSLSIRRTALRLSSLPHALPPAGLTTWAPHAHHSCCTAPPLPQATTSCPTRTPTYHSYPPKSIARAPLTPTPPPRSLRAADSHTGSSVGPTAWQPDSCLRPTGRPATWTGQGART